MGMFDEIAVLGPSPLKCAAGHEVREVQTKDFAQTGTEFILNNGRLYEPGEDPIRGVALQDDGSVFLRTDRPLHLVQGVHALHVYATCDQCEPVYSRFRDNGSKIGRFGGLVDETKVWAEWALLVKDGVVMECKPVHLQSRDQLREATQRALSDSDPLVIAHKQLLAEGL